MMLGVVVSLVLGVGGAFAEDDVIAAAFEACQPELETYCSQVTPGDGRLLACFFAHEDKVSGKCNWAIYQAAVAVEEFFSAIAHVLRAACRMCTEMPCRSAAPRNMRIRSLPSPARPSARFGTMLRP